MGWRPTIGLEIHAELGTKTKMFCNSKNDPRETRPNVNICPVCVAHPGTLPVVNRSAVEHVVRLGHAVSGTIADYTEFDRKNYFYPDIPKGYQISQYAYPIVSGGTLNGVAITRVHLEEDTARSSHVDGETLIDYNRAGVPLMELVTEPVIHDAETAAAFARELQLLLRKLGASEANMEEGQMRIEANISVSRDSTFGTKVEVKNINSFKAVERAIAFEVARQIELIENGGQVTQETRGWDDARGETFAQRKKESSHDYRYFPDPDLPKLKLSEDPAFASETIRGALPELPWQQRDRYISIGLKPEDAEMFVRSERFGNFFDRVTANGGEVVLAANYLASDVAGAFDAGLVTDDWLANRENANRFAGLMTLVASKKVSSRGAKEILAKLFSDTREPQVIAQEYGLYQQSDAGVLEAIARSVIDEQKAVVADYLAGKDAALQFLVGQGMKASRGSADPAGLREAFIALLPRKTH